MRSKIENLEKLIKEDKYQVLLMSCPIFFFARHPWFVLNEKGKISRYEIMHFKSDKTNNYLHINEFLPFISFITYTSRKFNIPDKPILLKCIEGDEGSLAHKAIEFIKNSGKNYPFLDKYSLVAGPNSNTYAQWVLNKFPEFNIKLSWRFIGKNYKIEVGL